MVASPAVPDLLHAQVAPSSVDLRAGLLHVLWWRGALRLMLEASTRQGKPAPLQLPLREGMLALTGSRHVGLVDVDSPGTSMLIEAHVVRLPW